MRFPENIQNLIDQFSHLPGVGPKTAERYVFWLLKEAKQTSFSLSAAINNLANSITHCEVCHMISETNPCLICADNRRDSSQICIVSETHDVNVIENTGLFKGYYHILNGVLDPIHAVTPDKLTFDSLLSKIQKNSNIKEAILALNPDMEGEATIHYLKKILEPLKIKITRLAQGLPTGSDLEYADANTLSKAYKYRTEV